MKNSLPLLTPFPTISYVSPISLSSSSISSNSFIDILPQLDGNDTLKSSSSSLDISVDCLTVRDPVVFRVNEAGKVEVDPALDPELPYLPLMTTLNFRSIYNKVGAFCDLIKELGIEAVAGVESWERHKYPLDDLLSGTGLTIVSKYRQKVRNNQPGGGCCILVNPNRLSQ